MSAEPIFATYAPKLRELGFQPRPVMPGTKACKVKGWQKPEAELGPRVFESWLSKYADYGIGLLLGSALPNGLILGGLDIDHDAYAPVAVELLGGVVSGRVGARGGLYFVAVRGEISYREFKVKFEGDADPVKVGELLVSKKLAVMPPSIHPLTNEPYRWLGTPLTEIDPTTLPIIEV